MFFSGETVEDSERFKATSPVQTDTVMQMLLRHYVPAISCMMEASAMINCCMCACVQ
jgi:hypothetical protein